MKEQFKRVHVIKLSTNEKATGDIRMSIMTGGLLYKDNTAIACNVQHLYITSDDEIKEADWYLEPNVDVKPTQCKKVSELTNDDRKIIATTDTSLHIPYVTPGNENLDIYEYSILPKPSQQFIEKYIESYNKDNIITDVSVEYEDYWEKEYYPNGVFMGNKILRERLKINPDNTITIKSTKNSWNREEIEKKLFELLQDISADETLLEHYSGDYREFKNWIKQNL